MRWRDIASAPAASMTLHTLRLPSRALFDIPSVVHGSVGVARQDAAGPWRSQLAGARVPFIPAILIRHLRRSIGM